MFISILLLSGCFEKLPESNDVVNTMDNYIERGKNLFESIIINDDKVIKATAELKPIDDKTINTLEGYHTIADQINFMIHFLNREMGLDLEELKGTQTEYEKLSRIITEYAPLIGNYNKIVKAATEYKNGNYNAREDYYKAVAEFSLELIIIQAAVFYKPSYKLTGIIYRNSGLNRLAFKCPSVVSHLLSSLHWYLRNLMVNKSSEVARCLIDEIDTLYN